jgi:hypothetical protein
MKEKFQDIRHSLGEQTASHNAAQELEKLLFKKI